MSHIATLPVLFLPLAMIACGGLSRVPVSQSPTLDSLTIFLEMSWLGDGRFVVSTTDSARNEEELFRIAFSDSNARLRELEWSPDGYKVGFLISTEDDNHTDVALLVFDLQSFPDSSIQRIFESGEHIVGFELQNGGVEYRLNNGSTVFFTW